MGEKFLATKRGRARLVWTLGIMVGLILEAIILATALSTWPHMAFTRVDRDSYFLTHPYPIFWVHAAQAVLLLEAVVVVGVIVIATLAGLLFGLCFLFVRESDANFTTLRGRLPRYDAVMNNIGQGTSLAVGLIVRPFRRVKSAIRQWINSGT